MVKPGRDCCGGIDPGHGNRDGGLRNRALTQLAILIVTPALHRLVGEQCASVVISPGDSRGFHRGTIDTAYVDREIGLGSRTVAQLAI